MSGNISTSVVSKNYSSVEITEAYCSSGQDFYILGVDGYYARCYHKHLDSSSFLGNITQETKFHQLSGDDRLCKFKISCINDSVCRGTCDGSNSLRFDPNSGKHFMKETSEFYEFAQADHVDQVSLENSKIFWHLTENCNYRCIYCPYPLSSKNYPTDHLIETFDIAINQFRKKLTIVFTGGEPTIHPKFFDLLDHMRIFMNSNPERDFYFHVISNMSLYKKWKRIADLNWTKPFGLIASCHITEPEFDLKEFTDTCLKIQSLHKDNYLEVSFVEHPHVKKYIPIYQKYFEARGLIDSTSPNKKLLSYAYDITRTRSEEVDPNFVPQSLKEAQSFI